MNLLQIFVALFLSALAGTITLFRKGGAYNPTAPLDKPTMPITTPEESPPAISNSPMEANTIPQTLSWDTPKQAYHSTRVLCDEMGLTLDEKNVICACIYQESQFNNKAVCHNRNAQGIITSSDWGLCQINDYWHIGANRNFPTVQYVLDNPDKCVKWMILAYKSGQLRMWVSYSSGVYQKWLSTVSPMWDLASA